MQRRPASNSAVFWPPRKLSIAQRYEDIATLRRRRPGMVSLGRHRNLILRSDRNPTASSSSPGRSPDSQYPSTLRRCPACSKVGDLPSRPPSRQASCSGSLSEPDPGGRCLSSVPTAERTWLSAAAPPLWSWSHFRGRCLRIPRPIRGLDGPLLALGADIGSGD